MAEIVTTDGEILPATDSGGRDIDVAASVSLVRAEIDIAIATAHRYPRSVAKAITKITELATLDEETAAECCYALIRKKKGAREQDEENKPIEGPSIRLAEIAVNAWRNSRVDARVITVNRQDKYVEAEGVFHDLESNVATRSVVRRNIRTSKGYLFSDDMIAVTSNAACSIAKRNAILAGIPRGVYGPGYRAARAVMAGTVQTLVENRSKVYKAFATYAVTPAQIHELLGVGGEADVGLDHIALLRATFASIKNGEATVAEMFGKEKSAGVEDPLGPSPKEPAKPEDAPKRTAEQIATDAEERGAALKRAAADTAAKDSAKARADTTETPSPGPSQSSVGEVGETSPTTAARERDIQEEVDDITQSGGARRAAKAEEAAKAIEKSAGGQEKPKAPEAVQKTEAPQAAAAAGGGAPSGAPVPKTEAEYVAHVRAYIAAAESAAGLENKWTSERPLRNGLVVTTEWETVSKQLLKEVRARRDELKTVAEATA